MCAGEEEGAADAVVSVDFWGLDCHLFFEAGGGAGEGGRKVFVGVGQLANYSVSGGRNVSAELQRVIQVEFESL